MLYWEQLTEIPPARVRRSARTPQPYPWRPGAALIGGALRRARRPGRAEAGVNEVAIAATLGHIRQGMTAHYAHVVRAAMRTGREAAGEELFAKP